MNPSPSSSRRNGFRQFIGGAAGRALLALALVMIVGAVVNADGAFFKFGTHRDALRQASVYGILACGMTLVIISGGIDLAVGSVVALAAVCAATMAIHWDWTGWLVAPACLAVGAATGAVSGAITARWRVQPFIATLAMMVFARGLAKHASGGMKVSTAVQNADGSYRYVPVPPMFRFVDHRILWGNVSVVSIMRSGRSPSTDLVRSNDERETTMRMPVEAAPATDSSGW